PRFLRYGRPRSPIFRYRSTAASIRFILVSSGGAEDIPTPPKESLSQATPSSGVKPAFVWVQSGGKCCSGIGALPFWDQSINGVQRYVANLHWDSRTLSFLPTHKVPTPFFAACFVRVVTAATPEIQYVVLCPRWKKVPTTGWIDKPDA